MSNIFNFSFSSRSTKTVAPPQSSPLPPATVAKRVSRHDVDSVVICEDLHHKRTVPSSILAAIPVSLGLLPPDVVDKKIVVQNDSIYPLIFLISPDPDAPKFEKGGIGVHATGVGLSLGVQSNRMVHQCIAVNAGGFHEIICGTNRAFVTVAKKLDDGCYEVYRYCREVKLGDLYRASEDTVMYKGDKREASFMDQFNI